MATTTFPAHAAGEGTHAHRVAAFVPIGRFLFAFIFILSGPRHFSPSMVHYAAAAGVPLPSLAVPLAGAIALAGGLSVLLGWHARVGAWLLVLFLVPVTLYMHAFWAVADPQAAQMQMVNFLKNLSMIGAALTIGWFGAGPLSLDARREAKGGAGGTAA